MDENYEQAAVRHFNDAEHLAAEGRHDNAGHLIGFAAECAIKHAVAALGHDSERLHLPALVGSAQRHLRGRRGELMRKAIGGSAFFDGWRVSRRYEPDGSTSAEQYGLWRTSASRALGAAGLRRAS